MLFLDVFGNALGKVMGELSRTHGFLLQNEVTVRAKEIVQTIFKNNPDRVAHELKQYDVGRASDADIALVIATLFGHLMVADAAYEGRKEITVSDVYLALADFEKARGWH